MRTALVVPPFNTIRQGYSSRFSISGGVTPPLGILYLAAVLRESEIDVAVFDGSQGHISETSLLNAISGYDPDLVGVYVSTPAVRSVRPFIERLITELSVPVVIGGPHPTYAPENVLDDFPGICAAFNGEAEKSLPLFIQCFSSRMKWETVPGLIFRLDETIRINPPDPVDDLDAIPLPARDLVDLSLYRPLPSQSRGRRMTSLITSRGCPYRGCRFCSLATKHAPRYRRRSPISVVSEMVSLNMKNGIEEFLFWDDNFAHDREWINRFCTELKDKLPGILWRCTGKADQVDRDLYRVMKRAGCFSILMGCESGSDHLLAMLGKNLDVSRIREARKICRKEGLEVRMSFMLGVPGESPRQGRETVRFAASLHPEVVNFFPFHPIPGTSLYDEAMKQGRLLSGWYSERGLHEINYLPAAYDSPAQLAKIMRSGYLLVYLHPLNLIRRMKLIAFPRRWGDLVRGVMLFLGILFQKHYQREKETE